MAWHCRWIRTLCRTSGCWGGDPTSERSPRASSGNTAPTSCSQPPWEVTEGLLKVLSSFQCKSPRQTVQLEFFGQGNIQIRINWHQFSCVYSSFLKMAKMFSTSRCLMAGMERQISKIHLVGLPYDVTVLGTKTHSILV